MGDFHKLINHMHVFIRNYILVDTSNINIYKGKTKNARLIDTDIGLL